MLHNTACRLLVAARVMADLQQQQQQQKAEWDERLGAAYRPGMRGAQLLRMGWWRGGGGPQKGSDSSTARGGEGGGVVAPV